MEKASKLITIKLNKKQATLLDLHTISKDTLEVIVLLSLLENVDDEIGEELRNIIRKNYPKKDLFRHSKKIKSYVHNNINRFSLEKIENGSI